MIKIVLSLLFIYGFAEAIVGLPPANSGIGGGHGGGGHYGRGASRSPAITPKDRVQGKNLIREPNRIHNTLKRDRPRNIDKRGPRPQYNQQKIDKVRGDFKKRYPNHRDWFNKDHRGKHRWSGNQAWRGSTWNNVSGWLPYGWSEPVYYDYGSTPYYVDTEPSYVDNSTRVNVNVAPPEPASEEGDWLSLGVFAAGRSSLDAPTSRKYVQLSISKEGELSGSYYNAITNKSYPLEGEVDKDSQLAAWTLSDNPNSPTMVTGIYNLTQNEAPVQVQFLDGSTQDWVFIRLTD